MQNDLLKKTRTYILAFIAVFVLIMLLSVSAQAESMAAATLAPGDIYISEVFEANGGSGKYVELYNAGATDVDLNDAANDISLRRYSNAGTSPTAIDLTGTIPAGDFYVVGHSDVNGIFGAGTLDQIETSVNHNGNDSYDLFNANGSVVLDTFAGDNIGTSPDFAANVVAYRIASQLPNNGNWGDTNQPADDSDSASGFWHVFNITSSNGNATAVATPGTNSGIEAPISGVPQLLITEIVVTPTAGEFVEIYNPGAAPVDLSDVYLTDATFAGSSTYYYQIVTGGGGGTGNFSDFNARFPDGASIAAGEYQTVALNGSDNFNSTYGELPTYELYDEGGAADGVPAMREATAGSIDNPGSGLTNSGEVAILYYWDGTTDLVTDLDYTMWGDTAEAVDKTGVSIDGPDGDTDDSTYLPDTAIGSQDLISVAAHPIGSSWQREDLTEGTEIKTGGNGAGGHNETSEDLSNTFCMFTTTPNAVTQCPPPPASDIIINEYQADPDATNGDANGDGTVNTTEDEFVEIINNSGADLDMSGWTLSDAGGVKHTFPTSTIVPNGCAVVVFGGGTPTGAFGDAIVQTASSGSVSLNNTGDTIIVNDGSSDRASLTYTGTSDDNQSLTRDPDISGPEPLVFHSTATGSGGALFSPGTQIDGTPFLGCQDIYIHDVQGSGSSVTAPGTTVTVEGVVVGDYQGSDELSGFFLQEEDSDADGDANTSEGIFVYCGGCAVAVAEGNIVEVTGLQEEYFNMSQIDVPAATGGSVVVVNAGDNSGLVTAATIDLPAPASTAAEGTFEQFEGMLVEFVDELTVTEYFELARFGQIILSEGGKLRQFTDTDFPDETGYTDHQNEIATRRIILDDLNNVQNIDPVYHPQAGGFSVSNFMRGGYTVSNLTGVMHWSYPGSGDNTWRIRPQITNPVSFTNSNPREAAPVRSGIGVAGDIKVASFNVLNYFTTIDVTASNNSGDCGPSGTLDCRGADSAAELTRQTDKIVAAMAIMNADIIGLMEIENNASPGAIDNLVTALNAAMGAGTYAYIDTGFIGTDAIKVGIIYKPDVVTPQGSYAVLDDLAFTDPFGTGTDKNRPALAQTFKVTAGSNSSFGESFTYVVNHLKSKGSGCGLGDDDTTTGQGNCNGTRTAAAAALLGWLNTDPTDTLTNLGVVDTDFLIGGDLNSYRLEDPITTLTNAGYTDLINSFEGPNAYSYVFSGEWGYLDHSLSSLSLTPQVVDVSIWHINSDEVNLLDYNDTIQDAGEASYEAKPATNPLYAADPYRASDHDPVIVGLNLTNIDTGSLPNYGAAWHTFNEQWLGSAWREDDGVVRTGSPWVPNAEVGINVDVTNGPGWLACWFDWDASLTFDNDELMVDEAVVNGINSISFTVPGDAATGSGQLLNTRCRLYPNEPILCRDSGAEIGCRTPDTPQSDAFPYGQAFGGEVEDYSFEFTPTAVSLQTFGVEQSINMVWLLLLVTIFGLVLSVIIVRRRNGRNLQ
ncbi:MAG: ExeM/NucH family extracellular endonuclease [Anaerolineales bacterium]|nr:ExeM/NucH family extracellular endonuclease [Anaerolineales bacterium]